MRAKHKKCTINLGNVYARSPHNFDVLAYYAKPTKKCSRNNFSFSLVILTCVWVSVCVCTLGQIANCFAEGVYGAFKVRAKR